MKVMTLLFQLLVIVNNVQTMAEPLFKQHEKTSRLIILWFQKKAAQRNNAGVASQLLIVVMPHWDGYGFTHS